MKTTFIGVGEALDDLLPNTSLHVASEDGTRLLLDCGFTAAHALFRTARTMPGGADMADVDAVYVSHFHADHFFGLPALILGLHQRGRTRDLTLVGQPGFSHTVDEVMELAYPRLFMQLDFGVEIVEVDAGQDLDLGGMRLSFAWGEHSDKAPNLAVRVDADNAGLFYSGDGRPTPATQALAAGCDAVVHEAFTLNDSVPGHGTIAGAMDFARQAKARHIALVHVERQTRQSHAEDIRTALADANDINGLLPEPGEILAL
jgi:ribonuclease BN (tRNA processing enzyme)